MMKSEFETIAGFEVTSNEYTILEAKYNSDTETKSKQEWITKWLKSDEPRMMFNYRIKMLDQFEARIIALIKQLEKASAEKTQLEVDLKQIHGNIKQVASGWQATQKTLAGINTEFCRLGADIDCARGNAMDMMARFKE